MDDSGELIPWKERLRPSPTIASAPRPLVDRAPPEETMRPATSPPRAVVGVPWQGHLFYVDQKQTLSLLSLIAAGDMHRNAVLEDPAITQIRSSIEWNDGLIPRDLNAAIVAKCLLYLTSGGAALPFLEQAETFRLGQPARIRGRVITVEKKNEMRVLRLDSSRDGRSSGFFSDGHTLRLVASELRDEEVIIAGFVRSPKFLQIHAAAAMIVVPRAKTGPGGY